MKIGIVHSGKSYLPEIFAYHSFLNSKKNIEAHIIKNKEIREYKYGDFDLLWKFPGVDLKRDFKDTKIIHEYNSLSVGSNKIIKNNFKKFLNIKPNGRIFLNKIVEDTFKFRDQVPSFNRDMGISNDFFIKTSMKEYDFVYIGTMNKSRGLNFALKPFISKLKEKTLLLVGEPENDLYLEYKKYNNIIFTGSVPYNEVARLASKAEYGFNYVPNIYPFNIQTSTKLLEYCAMGLKIITTRYEWVDKFEINSGGNFFKLNQDLSNFTIDELNKFSFSTPEVKDFEWFRLLEDLNILDFLKKL